MLEDDPKLQDAILTVHHACMHTLAFTPAIKIIENQKGIAYIMNQQAILVQNAVNIGAQNIPDTLKKNEMTEPVKSDDVPL